jgi:hypothetical protein
VVPEAGSEGLVIGFEDLVKECFDVLLMFLDELLLTSAFIDDETDTQGELIVVGEEADLLRNAVFDDGEVLLSETANNATVCVSDTKGGVDKMGLHFDDGNLLSSGKKCRQKC